MIALNWDRQTKMGENGRNDHGSSKYSSENTDAATVQPESSSTGSLAASAPPPKTQQTSSTSPQTTTNRFADYFVICGLDLDTGLEPDRFAGTY